MKTILFTLMAFLTMVVFTPANLSAQENNIVELAADNGDLSILTAALKAADLTSTLEGDGPFTVFAPTDEAFRALPEEVFQALLKAENRQALVDILKYHVAEGKLVASDVTEGINNATDGELMASSLNGDITAMLDGESVTLTDSKGTTATVVQADVMASNGVVHVIDAVLLPENIDIDALLAGEATGMMEDADEMKEDMTTEAGEMKEDMTAEANEMKQDVANTASEMTNEAMEEGEEMLEEGEEMVNDAGMAVENTMDDMTTNTNSTYSNKGGTNSIVKVASGNSDFSTLVTAVKAADLVDLLDGSESEFTVFAPTNDAFDKLPEGTVGELTQPAMKTQLQGVLSYHVVANKVSAADLTKAIEANNGFFRIQTISGQSLIASMEDGKVMLTDGNGNMATVVATDVAADNGVIHAIDTVMMPKE